MTNVWREFVGNSLYSLCPAQQRSTQKEKAQVQIEFALTLILLLMLTFGMIDVTRIAYTATAMQAAAQAGARAGVVNLNAVNEAVERELIGLDLQKMHITTTVSNNNLVEVQLTYEFEFITPMIVSLAPQGHLHLQARASMLTY